MVSRFNKHIIIIVILLCTWSSFAQGHLTSSVTLSKNSVYVGEPVQVTVSVFTDTWFTKGVNPGNIKVNGAFTVYFRSLSTSKQVNGKTYAGVQLFFNVFPHENKNIEFPALEIAVETPDIGGYKGIHHIVKTKPRTIKIKPIPPNFDADSWLVTSWMSVTENWKGDLKSVKVGDVIERVISRNASNTVSELIPPVQWDTISNVSLYPTRSTVRNNKTKTAISAFRSEGVRYLFEKEGTITIPEKVFTWWNPYKKKLYKKTLPEVTIEVLPNPDLGMLATIKKDLEATLAENIETEKKPFQFLGLSTKQLIVFGILLIFILFIFIKIILRIAKKIKIKRQNYIGSEAYYFNLLLKSLNSNNKGVITSKLYKWIDALNLKEPTISNLLDRYGSNSMITNFSNSQSNPKISKKDLKKIRVNYKNRDYSASNNNWINP